MQKTILYAVLNWGLGHATRSIPIIKHLIQEDFKVIIVSDGIALKLLMEEFPSLPFEETKTYNVHYASSAEKFNWEMASQIPKFIQAIKAEHQDCLVLCKKHEIDYIISDNRYGYHHPIIKSAFICHQLQLMFPQNRLVEKIINRSYEAYLKKFTQLWVPDNQGSFKLSGKMSKLAWKNIFFIGASSRFESLSLESKYTYAAILSGPEPQRSMLEEELLDKLSLEEGQHLLIRGGEKLSPLLNASSNIRVIDLAGSNELNELICQSEVIVCRAGYTSVLDLLKLKKKAILIPTPGQVEQEYLAKTLASSNYFEVQKQGAIVLKIPKNFSAPDISFGYDYELIRSFLSC